MRVAERARHLARTAAALARGAGVALPPELALFGLAGGPPSAVPAERAPDPARALVDALEASLTEGERRAGAHFTPVPLASRVAEAALPSPCTRAAVADPACGGGALLLAAAGRLAAVGDDPAGVARHQLWGADRDPLAVAVCEAAVALWSGGTAPAPGQLVCGDTLRAGAQVWPARPPTGFDAVVANPPFQSQLRARSARSRSAAQALRHRFGDAVTGYVDTAALFLLAAGELLAPHGRMAVVLPRSVAASRDAAVVRERLAERVALVDLWLEPPGTFAAKVAPCVAVMAGEGGDRRAPDGAATGWARRLARALDIPSVSLPGGRVVGDVADVVASFRDEYYGLVPLVHERAELPGGRPLVTSGRIDPGRLRAGPVRFARARWRDPVVSTPDGIGDRAGRRAAVHLQRVARPKVVVASQTRVVEAAVDVDGTWVPVTPTLSVLPDGLDPWALAVALCAPPVSAWVAAEAAGSGLSSGAVRLGAPLLARIPLPADAAAWEAAASAFRRWAGGHGSIEAWARPATASYGIAGTEAEALGEWWRARLPSPP